MPRGSSAVGAARNATPIFFPEKENGRRPSKRKAFPIESEQLEEVRRLPIALPARGKAALALLYDLPLLLLSAAALLIL